MKLKSVVALFLIIFYSCSREDDCFTITEKRVIDGKYYFYFDAQDRSDAYPNNNPGLDGGYPDRYGSGQVDRETFESTNVGDKYCE
jgi:hypothetical protein